MSKKGLKQITVKTESADGRSFLTRTVEYKETDTVRTVVERAFPEENMSDNTLWAAFDPAKLKIDVNTLNTIVDTCNGEVLSVSRDDPSDRVLYTVKRRKLAIPVITKKEK